MPRIARVVAVDVPHHVTQRGNNRQDVFFDDDDRRFYLTTLAKCAGDEGLALWAYCLMRNHVHVLAVPEGSSSLARAMGIANLVYTQHVNRKYSRSGRLWQNRFFSCPIDCDSYLWSVARYIESNPVRARLVRKPWEYRWSSAAFHVGREANGMLTTHEWLDAGEYREYLLQPVGSEQERIRAATASGRPLGKSGFVAHLERKLQRALTALPRGRPRRRRRKNGKCPCAPRNLVCPAGANPA